MRDLRILFMGTPDFAVATLDAILKANYKVVGVVTAPDKPAGRGQKIHQSAVKIFAQSKGLTILQPTNLKDQSFINELKSLNANLQIVVAFRMLPNIVWQMPEFGTFNLHASLLPNYRGAAPINWAIINGETETGVSTFFIDEKIDTGNIILQEKTAISETDTVGQLHDTLMNIGSELVVKTVRLIEQESFKTTEQQEVEEKPAPKIFTETCKINWNDSLNNIYNLIRGLNPYPAAWCVLKNSEEIKVKIYDVSKQESSHDFTPGTIISTKKELKVAVKNGYIIIESIQLAGKKKMDTKNLLNGFTFVENSTMQ